MVQLAAVISVRQVYVGEDVCVRLMRCMHIVSSKFMAVVSLSSSVQLSLHTEEEVLPPTQLIKFIPCKVVSPKWKPSFSINTVEETQRASKMDHSKW